MTKFEGFELLNLHNLYAKLIDKHLFLFCFLAMQPNCFTITYAEKVECVLNTNTPVCIPLGCYWNPNESYPKPKCYTKR